MNAITRHTALAAIAAAAVMAFAGSAHAQEATYDYPQKVVSTVSRAEVRAEYLQARAAGTLQANEADFQRQPTFVASKGRAEVVAEVRADAGASRALTAEPHGFDAPRVAVATVQTRIVAAR